MQVELVAARNRLKTSFIGVLCSPVVDVIASRFVRRSAFAVKDFGAAASPCHWLADYIRKFLFFWVVGDNMTYAKRFKALMFGLAVCGRSSRRTTALAAPEITGRPVEHQLNLQPPVTGIAD